MTEKTINLGKDIITPIVGVVTLAQLTEDFNAGKFARASEVVSQGISHAQLVVALAGTVPIVDFWGGAESPVAVLEEIVPEGFPKRMKDVNEGPLNPSPGTPMTFREYAKNFLLSIDKKSVLFKVGYTDDNKNLCHKVSDEELRAWITLFGISNITVWKDYKALSKSSKYSSGEF